MRFTLATVGTRGDVQPLLAVAVELRRRGHQALVGAPAKFERWVREHDVEFASVGVDPEELLAAEKSPGRMRALMKADAQRQFETLAETAKGSDLIVGAGVVLAASSVAELMRVPFVGAVFSPQTLPSAEHPFPPLAARRPPKWVNRLSWWLGSAVYGWLTLPLLNALRKSAGLSPHTSAVEHMFGNDVLLASEPLFGAAPADARVPVEQTGAWLYDGPPLSPELEGFVGAGSPPVFVGFGSNRDENKDQTVGEIISGLRLAGVRGVIAGSRPASIEADAGLCFVEFADFRRLFPRCALVVHHGGAGTTATAAISGVPQWIVAHRGDQYDWAHRVDGLRLGPASIGRKTFDAKRLAEAIREASSAPELVERCRAFAARMTTDGTQRAADALERRVRRKGG